MIKNNQISLDKGKVLDLKPNLSLSEADTNDFLIIDIGASVVRLKTLDLFSENMHVDSVLTFKIIQHLESTHTAIIPEFSQKKTETKVIQVTEICRVKTNCINVIPPDKRLFIINGRRHLFVFTKFHGLQLPADILLKSLAINCTEKSMGVIFSKLISDWNLGLKAIAKENGIAAIQDLVSSEFNFLRSNTIESIVPDILVWVTKSTFKRIIVFHYLPEINRESELLVKTKNSINKISRHSWEQTKHDFSRDKKNTLRRRIERRKGIHQIDKMQSYLRFLQENRMEFESLCKEL